jgi:17beta-estradiol 17-dehydrogenase / very-long-chain 3-oxoacyl-CoA reductase
MRVDATLRLGHFVRRLPKPLYAWRQCTLIGQSVNGECQLKKYGAGEGSYAVITGATDGIGREFANHLAKRKLNLVLVSRTAAKLAKAADEIRKYERVFTL